MCVCLPYVSALYVSPCVSTQGELNYVHPHASSAVIYLCATSFVYKSSQSSPWCTKLWRLKKGEHVRVVWLVYFRWTKSTWPVVLFIIIGVQCTQCLNVPNSLFRSSEKVWSKPQTCVKDSQCWLGHWDGLSGEWMSVSLCLCFSQKHNGMINTSGIWLVQERVNHFSFPSVKIYTVAVTFSYIITTSLI